MDRTQKIEVTAQQLVDLLVWEESEESGETQPHLNRTIPDFNTALTALRDALVTN